VTVTAALEHPSVAPGGETTLALVLDIADEWHTYWQNPGDSGAPIHVAFLATEGAEVGALQWPAPKRYIYSDGQSLDYVYEHQAVLLAPVRVSKDAKPGSTVSISVSVEYLVCKEACIPGDASLEIELDIAEPGEAAASVESELFGSARALIPQEEPALAEDGVVVQWAGMTLMLSAPGAEGVSYYPLAPDLPRPEDAIRDGDGEGDTLTIVYPYDIKNAQLVEGVFEASIRGEKRLYRIATEPPKRR
jgi:thiol:disulfide interchange protein DsbD